VLKKDSSGLWRHRTFEEFKKAYCNYLVEYKEDKYRELGAWWIHHSKRREYETAKFLPGQEHAPNGVLNLWSPWAVQATEGDCHLWLQFLHDIICNGSNTHYDYLLGWLAHMIQKPQEQSEVALVMRGDEGIGKGFFAKRFGELLGPCYRRIGNPKHLTGNFNSHLDQMIAVFVDEAFFAGNPEHARSLRGLVTEDSMMVEPKGIDAREEKRYFRIIMASNDDWVVPAGMQDRRYFVLDVPSTYKEDRNYFGAIDSEWKRGGREAFMHLLTNLDIATFRQQKRPETAGLTEQKLMTLSQSPAKKVIYEMLCNGDPPIGKTSGLIRGTDDARHVFVPTRELARQHRLHDRDETALGRELLKLSGAAARRETCRFSHTYEAQYDKSDERSSGKSFAGGVRTEVKQYSGYWLPSLQKARERWCTQNNITIDWSYGIVEWELPGIGAEDEQAQIRP
jgi:hypothetical protein